MARDSTAKVSCILKKPQILLSLKYRSHSQKGTKRLHGSYEENKQKGFIFTYPTSLLGMQHSLLHRCLTKAIFQIHVEFMIHSIMTTKTWAMFQRIEFQDT